MRALLLICFLLTPVLAYAADGAKSKDSLDGRSFDVQMTEQGKALDTDQIVFSAGKAEAPGVHKRFSFEKAAYTATVKGGETTFTVTMTSTEHGQIVLTGTIKGHDVSGTRTWSKPGKDPIIHQFSGKESASAK